MKLPQNPTPEQIKAVVQLIIRSSFTRGSLSVETVTITGGEAKGIFLGNGVKFQYVIRPGSIEYSPVNPSDLPDESNADLSEDALDFARLKLAGNTKQVKACKKGYACGYTCISQNRNCRNPLQGQFKTASEWLTSQDTQTMNKGKGYIDRAKLPSTQRAVKDYLEAVEKYQDKPYRINAAKSKLEKLAASGQKQLNSESAKGFLSPSEISSIKQDISLINEILSQ